MGELLWACAGIERSGQGLARGLARWWGLAASGARAWDAVSPLAVSRLVLEAALRREESRGAHFRSDYPEARPRWSGSLRVRRGDDGEPVFRFQPAPAFAEE